MTNTPIHNICHVWKVWIISVMYETESVMYGLLAESMRFTNKIADTTPVIHTCQNKTHIRHQKLNESIHDRMRGIEYLRASRGLQNIMHGCVRHLRYQ